MYRHRLSLINWVIAENKSTENVASEEHLGQYGIGANQSVCEHGLKYPGIILMQWFAGTWISSCVRGWWSEML